MTITMKAMMIIVTITMIIMMDMTMMDTMKAFGKNHIERRPPSAGAGAFWNYSSGTSYSVLYEPCE